MDNDKLMKLIMAPTNNLGAYYKIIEQQEKIAKVYSPVLTMSSTIQHIIQHYEKFNSINKSFQIPLTISDTIQRLANQSAAITNSYSKYHDQLNAIVNVINPTLSRFFIENSRTNFRNAEFVNDIDLGIVNSFDSVKDDYDDVVQAELDEIKVNFESKSEFKNDVENLLGSGEIEITTDIYQAFAQLIEKYVGITNSKAIGLFLNILITAFCILMPFYQNSLGTKTEERLIFKIDNFEENVNKSIDASETKILDKVNSLDNEIENTEKRILKAVGDSIEKSNEQIIDINQKLDLINEKLDKLDNDKKN